MCASTSGTSGTSLYSSTSYTLPKNKVPVKKKSKCEIITSIGLGIVRFVIASPKKLCSLLNGKRVPATGKLKSGSTTPRKTVISKIKNWQLPDQLPPILEGDEGNAVLDIKDQIPSIPTEVLNMMDQNELIFKRKERRDVISNIGKILLFDIGVFFFGTTIFKASFEFSMMAAGSATLFIAIPLFIEGKPSSREQEVEKKFMLYLYHQKNMLQDENAYSADSIKRIYLYALKNPTIFYAKSSFKEYCKQHSKNNFEELDNTLNQRVLKRNIRDADEEEYDFSCFYTAFKNYKIQHQKFT